MRQKEEETSGITAAQQDVNVDRSEESWGSLHEQYEQMIGIKSNSSTSTISAANQKKIEEEIAEEMLKISNQHLIEDEDNYSDEDFNFGLNEV